METTSKGASPVKGPGLKTRKRARGVAYYWIPRADAVRAGYPSGTVNLSSLYDGTPQSLMLITARCASLQADMLLWLSGYRRERGRYDGTIRSLLIGYQTHPESPFHALKPSTRRVYTVYLRRLIRHVGGRYLDSVTGLDVQAWHKVWIEPEPDGAPKIAAGAMVLKVLKAAITFGVVCGITDCQAFRQVLGVMKFPGPKPRRVVAVAADVRAAREAAHAAAAPSRALAYAIQFEAALRQWDVIGEWKPLGATGFSTVVDERHGAKWFGLCWEHIGPDMVLRYTPGKTERTTGTAVVIDLTLCPMVIEEIANIPPARRVGPLIVSERTGLPYRSRQFLYAWRRDFAAAGLPHELWNRDMRASAVTEGRRHGATTDDASKVAGHAKAKITAEVYDRAVLEAQRRFQRTRVEGRERE